tara:strand:- start:5153 stop:5743 length:591 start_codon:yes stop_codon:yes gene_type:complete
MSNPSYNYSEFTLATQHKNTFIGATGKFVKAIKMDDASVNPTVRVGEPSADNLPFELNTKVYVPDGTAGIYLNTTGTGTGVIGILFSWNVDVDAPDDILADAAESQIKGSLNTSVTDAATLVPALTEKLSGRRFISIKNIGANAAAIINSDGTGTFALGRQIAAGGSFERFIKESVNIYAICDTGLTTTLQVYQDA